MAEKLARRGNRSSAPTDRRALDRFPINGALVLLLLVLVFAGIAYLQRGGSSPEALRAEKFAVLVCGPDCYVHSIHRIGPGVYRIALWRTESDFAPVCYRTDILRRKVRTLPTRACA